MRKIAPLVFVFALLTAACGGGGDTSSGPVDTAAASQSTAADRERNVQVGGWGRDGSGEATVKLYDRVSTSVTPRTFRRVRVETNGSMKVVNTRDVFMTWQVMRTTGRLTTSTIVVAGYDTTGDDEFLYPIAAIGGDGVVDVVLEGNDPRWERTATAWTVVSRSLLAVFLGSASDDASLGLVEYYDLGTGKLATNVGDGGRTIVSRDVGMSWVDDFALRSIDDDGTPHFSVIGPVYVGDQPLSDVIVGGFTPDGKPDPKVGGPGGRFSVYPSLDRDARDVHEMVLADPGLSAQNGNVGMVLRTPMTNVPGGFGEQSEVTALMAVVNRDSGVVSMTPNPSFMRVVDIGTQRFSIGSVALVGRENLAFHVTAMLDTEFGMPQRHEVAFDLSTRRRIRSTNPVDPAWRFDEQRARERVATTINVSDDGKEFVSTVFRDAEARKIFAAVCFGVEECRAPRNPMTVDLADIAPNENTWSAVRSVVADSRGAYVVVRTDRGEGQSAGHSLVSFDDTGSAAGGANQLDDLYGTSDEIDETKADVDAWETMYSIDPPTAVGQADVFAPRFDRAKGMSVHTQKVGSAAVDIPLSLPLGVSGISAAPSDFARVDADTTAVVANVVTEKGEERRVYFANLTNGSIEAGFGPDGYVVMPHTPADDDECDAHDALMSGEGVVANVYLDTDVVSVDGTKTCADDASQAVWTTYSLDGKPIGSGESRADLADVPGNELMGLAVDAQGSLYAARTYTVVDDAGEWQATGFRIGKFTPLGQLDRSYGTNGVIEVSEPRFDWRGTIAADAQGRVYLATTSNDGDGNPTVVVVRFTSSGSLDKATTGSAVTATTATANTSAGDNAASDGGGTGADRRERTAARNEIVSEKAELAAEERQRAAVIDTLPANNGLTVATEMPVLTSVKAIEDRSLSVTWALSVAIGRPYVTATASPGGRSCTSTEGSCVIRGLDPTESYVVTLAKKGEDAVAVTLADVIATKPVVSMRLGRVASPTTFVRPASRGKATWKVRGGCTLNDTNTRVTAPKSPTVCILSITTAKDGTTPKTTRSVTIVVKK